MDLPATLRPSDEVEVTLPSAVVRLPVCRPVFTRWSGAPVAFTFGGKPVLDHEGKPCFAELVILRILLAHGWSGAWVELFGGGRLGRFLQSMPNSAKLNSDVVMPDDMLALLDGPCLDVMAWHGSDVLFCEAKQHKSGDKLKPPQLRFIEGALARGIPREAMLVVEWATGEAMSSAAQ